MTRDAGLGSRAPRPLEVELKYRIRDLVVGERYLVADEIAGFTAAAPTHTTQAEDRYLDTSDGALARAGFAARLRVTTRSTLVTVKSVTERETGGALHRREELEGPADRTAPPRDWPPSDARSLILELCGDAPLLELVTIRQLRRKRPLRSGGTMVELSLDEVDVVARSQVIERFVELEVELVRGDEALLADLAAQLAADPGLAPSAGSKLEIALAAVRAHDPKPRRAETRRGEARRGGARARPRAVRATPPPAPAPAPEPPAATPPAITPPGKTPPGKTPTEAAKSVGDAPESAPLVVGAKPGVLGDDTVAEAGRKVLRFHLARMLAREPGTRSGADAKDLHGMRVATRRMRAAWRVFGDGYRPDRTRRYRKRLRQAAARLGAVRDLDVLLDGAESYRAALAEPERVALEPMFAAWRRYREDARVLLVHELDSRGYASFIEDYRVFVQTEGAAALPVSPTRPHRVRDTAPSRIWAAYEQVRAYEPVLRWADVETLHELRIAGKWLRYTIEFVREALGPDAAPLIARVTALQDHLGEMHDADVAASMARTFLTEHAATLSTAESAAIGRYLASREREVTRLQQSVAGPWRGVAGLGFRRALGRLVAGL